jgi:hypothetical protein
MGKKVLQFEWDSKYDEAAKWFFRFAATIFNTQVGEVIEPPKCQTCEYIK